jgi:hypothetical protein
VIFNFFASILTEAKGRELNLLLPTQFLKPLCLLCLATEKKMNVSKECHMKWLNLVIFMLIEFRSFE